MNDQNSDKKVTSLDLFSAQPGDRPDHIRVTFSDGTVQYGRAEPTPFPLSGPESGYSCVFGSPSGCFDCKFMDMDYESWFNCPGHHWVECDPPVANDDGTLSWSDGCRTANTKQEGDEEVKEEQVQKKSRVAFRFGTIAMLVDPQTDFLERPGILKAGTAQEVENMRKLIERVAKESVPLIITMDKHDKGLYPRTREGQLYPEHCTDEGVWHRTWTDQLDAGLAPLVGKAAFLRVVEKPTLGSLGVAPVITDELRPAGVAVHRVILFGCHYEACVLANAITLATKCPDLQIVVVSDACSRIKGPSEAIDSVFQIQGFKLVTTEEVLNGSY